MAHLPQPFNANDHATGISIGKHKVIVSESEIKATKAGDGGYLELRLKVIEGLNKGAMIPYRLNLFNNNPQAVEIANQQFAAICHATGIHVVEDSEVLHNIPFVVEVGPQKNDPSYTEVKKVFDANGNIPGKAPQTPAVQPAATQEWGQTAVQAATAPVEQPATQPTASWGQPATPATAPATVPTTAPIEHPVAAAEAQQIEQPAQAPAQGWQQGGSMEAPPWAQKPQG